MRSEIKKRYQIIKQLVIDYIKLSLECFNKDPKKSAIVINDTLYIVNTDVNYTIDGNQLAQVLTRIQEIVDEILINDGIEKFWAGKYIADMYRIGTNRTFQNLSSQSSLYAQATSLESLLFSDVYIRRIGLAYTATFNDWKGIADSLKSDLGNVLSNAVARGINPKETAKIISDRIDVSYSKANSLAQTEQVGALRRATWDETRRVEEELGLKTGLLHISALKPNSRATHVARHGKVYAAEQVEEWYEESGNRYNCYCAQVTVLLNDKGVPYNQAGIDRLVKEADKWESQNHDTIGEGFKADHELRQYPEFSSVEEVNKWASGKITQVCKISANVDVNELSQCIQLVSDLQKRFNFPRFRYIGSVSNDVYRYNPSKEMLAAFSPDANSLLITKKSFDANLLLKDDIRTKYSNFKEHSLYVVKWANHKQLENVINQMEYIPWNAVPTPRGIYAHEMGHVLHHKYGMQVESIAREGWHDGWAFALSKYSQDSIEEFIAESFSLFIENKMEAQKRLYPPLYEFFNSVDKAK